ncbi:MAG TPA: segregation/condensation protein A [bacterium]|nr:segregation/condensation protein A [bacterium]
MIVEFRLDITGYKGTYELLIENVRRHEVDIIEVRLSEVAQSLIDFVGKSPELFLFTPFVNLSRLMYVKSRNLLPCEDPIEELDLEEDQENEEQEEPTRVRERLLDQYQQFVSVRDWFRELGLENSERIKLYQTKEGSLPDFIDEIVFLEKVTPYDILYTMVQINRRALEDRSYHVKIDDARILSMRISEVFDFIVDRRGEPVSFKDLVEKKPEKVEAVLSFLAIVYLVTQGKIIAQQAAPYGDIIISVKKVD